MQAAKSPPTRYRHTFKPAPAQSLTTPSAALRLGSATGYQVALNEKILSQTPTGWLAQPRGVHKASHTRPIHRPASSPSTSQTRSDVDRRLLRIASRQAGSQESRPAFDKHLSDAALAKLVPEGRQVFPTLTVERNLSIARKSTRFRRWQVKEMFEIFSALEHLLGRESENLSGGEMQMVAISRALLGSPGLVLMDEPSQGLAPKIVQDVMATIRRMKDEGLSVLVVEQNAVSALSVADRVYVMDHGRIVHEGTAADLLADDARREQLLGI